MPERLRDRMPLLDRLRYAIWRLARRSVPIDVRLDLGLSISLRPWPAMDLTEIGTRSLSGAFTITIPTGVCLPPESVRRVVDLGANIGCTLSSRARLLEPARGLRATSAYANIIRKI